MTVSTGTVEAYLATRYEVFAPALSLRIGLRSEELRELMREAGVRDVCFVTAHNPFGELRSAGENAARQEALATALEAAGIRCLPGEGRGAGAGGPAGAVSAAEWPAEASVLALGVDEAAARELCRRFDQNAVVIAGADAVPRLLWHPAMTLPAVSRRAP